MEVLTHVHGLAHAILLEIGYVDTDNRSREQTEILNGFVQKLYAKLLTDSDGAVVATQGDWCR